MPLHHWHAVEPDGQRTEFQCDTFANRWQFSFRRKRRTDWQPLTDLRRRHWDALHAALANKYQRRRIPFELLRQLEAVLRELPADPHARADHPSAHAPAAGEMQRSRRDRRQAARAAEPMDAADESRPTPEAPPPHRASPWPARDQAILWHPFTPMEEWTDPANPPLVLTDAAGSFLRDEAGNRYFDGNASIWTNLHGHAHPALLQAIKDQLDRLDHASFLGTTHPKAIELAERLLAWANGPGHLPAPVPVPPWNPDQPTDNPSAPLARVFFSDNGSTALEVALRLALQVRQAAGQPERTGFLAFTNGYHGDTLGAASVSGVSRFFERFREHHFPCEHIGSLRELRRLPQRTIDTLTAVVIEPGIQGVNQMRPWPKNLLPELRDWCDEHGLLLILDEVLTGFGRSGAMFAFQDLARDGHPVRPDLLCLAKGLTGGTLPLAATLATTEVYDALLDPAQTFHYGHSYTANPPACAAALASLDLFEQPAFFPTLRRKIDLLAALLTALRAQSPPVHEIRQYGLISGIELRHPDGSPFDPDHRVGAEVCLAARAHGLLTRPIADTVVFLPPLSASEDELREALQALRRAIQEAVED